MKHLIYEFGIKMPKIFTTLIISLSLCVGAVWAGDVEDADTALDKHDYVTALKKYKSAAAKNDAYSQVQVGNFYNEGLGVKKDSSEAVRWYKLAAAQGLADAQYNLGLMYYYGQGVVQDYAEAVRLYKLAAAQGLADAQNNLGIMYANGQGVVQNYVQAHLWFNLAAVKGDKDAVKNRDSVASKMTTEQIGKAQKLARECEARNYKNCD